MSKQPAQPQHPAGLIDSIQSEVAGEASPLLELLLNNARLIIACVILCIIAIVGVGAYKHFSGKSDREAREEFGKLSLIQDHKKRLAALEAYLPKAPEQTRANALFSLAQTAFAAEEFQKSHDAWAEVAKLNPDLRVPAGYGMARALAAQNKPKEALDVYEKLIGGIAKPDILPVNTEIAWLAESMGDYKRAELAGQAVLAIPDLDPAYRKVWTIRVADLQQRSAQAK